MRSPRWRESWTLRLKSSGNTSASTGTQRARHAERVQERRPQTGMNPLGAPKRSPRHRLADELSRSEARHHATYLTLARTYFDEARVEQRLDALLDREAEVMRGLPLRPALH